MHCGEIIPKLPRLFRYRGKGKILKYFGSLSDSQRREFIREHLRNHLFPERIAREIAQRYGLTYEPELRLANLDFKVQEQRILNLRKRLKPNEKYILDNSVLVWFARCNTEQKIRILRKKLYGADPLKFIDLIISTYRKTKNRVFLELFVNLDRAIIPEMVRRGFLKDLVDAGFFHRLVKTYYKELADLGYIGEIIRDGSTIRALVNSDINGERHYLRLIANYGPQGINVLIRNGFAKQLAELGYTNKENKPIASNTDGKSK